METERAIAYIRARGDAVQRARLEAVLWGKRASQEVVRELGTRQKPDGGFAYWLPQVSNLCDTTYILHWFDDLGIYRGPPVDSACRFLLDRQQPDGGWDEVETVKPFHPPDWMIPGRVETRTWLTAYCAHVLLRFGYAESPGTHCPTDYLLAQADEAGRLAGYLRATWIALPMLAFYPGRDSAAFGKAMAVVEASYSPDWEGAYLGWLLRCLEHAGLPPTHPLVARSLDDLQRKQRPDGSWSPEEGEGEEHAVQATVEALRALHGYGRI